MISLDIKINDVDAKKLAAALANVGPALFTPMLWEIGERARGLALDAFETEASPEGQIWPVSERAKAEDGQTLTDTAILRNSLSVLATGMDSVEVSSNLPYAAIHQLGGKAGVKHSVTLPARPFLPDPAGAPLELEVLEAFQTHIQKAFR